MSAATRVAIVTFFSIPELPPPALISMSLPDCDEAAITAPKLANTLLPPRTALATGAASPKPDRVRARAGQKGHEWT